jgi:hypothetical protein
MLQHRTGAWLWIAAQLPLFYWLESLSSVLNSGGATNLAMRLGGGRIVKVGRGRCPARCDFVILTAGVQTTFGPVARP